MDAGEGAEPQDSRAAWRRSPVARVAVVVAVVIGLATLGLVVGQRNRDAFDRTAARVQAQARATGDGVDLVAFQDAWNAQTSGATPGASDALVPRLDGAEVARYVLVADPPELVVDYQIDEGGQQACIRMVRSVRDTQVEMERHPCRGAFVET